MEALALIIARRQMKRRWPRSGHHLKSALFVWRSYRAASSDSGGSSSAEDGTVVSGDAIFYIGF